MPLLTENGFPGQIFSFCWVMKSFLSEAPHSTPLVIFFREHTNHLESLRDVLDFHPKILAVIQLPSHINI